METKKDRLLLVIAVSALFVIAGLMYIFTFSNYLDSSVGAEGRVALSPFDESQGVQFSPEQCSSCPYRAEILCELIWKC